MFFIKKGTRSICFRLSTCLTVTFFMISLIILITSCINIFSFYSDTMMLINNQKELISQKAVVKIKGYIQEKIKCLEKIIEVGNLINEPLNEQEKILRKLVGKGESFSLIILTDENNKERARVSRFSNYYSANLIKYSPERLISDANGSKVYVSNVWIDQNTCEPMMTIGVPVTDLFGDIKGAIIAVTNLKFMWDLMKEIEIGKDGLAYIIDKNSTLIAFSDISRVLKGENVGQLKEAKDFIFGDSASHDNRFEITRGILGKYSVTTHVHLNFPDWAVVIELPVMEVYEPLIKGIIVSVFSMILCFFVAVCAGKYLLKKISQPVKELSDAAKKISDGNLNTTVIVKSDNEIGELAFNFNEMIKKLRKSTTSIKNLHSEIAEREKIEEKLRESEEKFRTLSISLPIGVMLLKKNGTVLFTNPQWEKIFDKNEVEKIWKGWDSFIFGDSLQKVEKAWGKLLSSNEMFSEELCIMGPQQEEVWLNIKGVAINSEKDTKILVIAEDVTNRKQAEFEAERSRMKLISSEKLAGIGQLAAGVAHEINNPVGFVLGNSEMLKEHYDAIMKYVGCLEILVNNDEISKKRNEYEMDYILNDVRVILDDNLNGLHRIVEIVANLKDFARVEQSNAFVDADLEENLNITIKIANNSIKYQADIKKEYGKISPVYCNISEINQVFLNMIINAAQAINESHGSRKGLITIKTSEDENNVYCSFADDGPGISEKYRTKIFEPFFTTKPVGKGTGLGLNIAWDIIVNKHGGDIIVETEPGKGTCFTIRLLKGRNVS